MSGSLARVARLICVAHSAGQAAYPGAAGTLPSIHYFLFRVYRRLAPENLRDSSVGKWVERWAPHDFVYNPEYFRDVIENHSGAAARAMAESIVRDLAPASVIDIGCGTGNLLEALRERGCEVFGMEYAVAALEACKRRKIPVRRVNLESNPITLERRYDVVCSIEVAEHLPERCADRYVDLLARAGETLVFTAAPPGQGGTDHVNEQPPSYWISRLEQHGLFHDATLSAAWREEWEKAGVQWWFWRNIMVFRRKKKAQGAA
jgi:SAM-dependent methyltransferase